ncbi:hypothetical protein ETD86_00520 [Nonomuraea turkmeniaca]|uniref:Uncharacterized protein n=1 Tax=Nonomuraea turkmeniaca TaxID=103838 RepID=A0A5S4FXY4_9ACTN|nr:hypothetical protein [Nonomuraea turkmeniaca]TMR25645.1 hypothetical protein ETD86_00520 [Nonomuraea turkmeniaca]
MDKPSSDAQFAVWRHAMIGSPGPPPDEDMGTRVYWGDLQPLREPRALPPPDRVWSEREWQIIRRGHVPADMDDKWVAFVEHDRLYLHRSWTGDQLFQADFQPCDQGWQVIRAAAESRGRWRKRKYARSDRLLLELLIDTVLLGTYDEVRWRRLWELEN